MKGLPHSPEVVATCVKTRGPGFLIITKRGETATSLDPVADGSTGRIGKHGDWHPTRRPQLNPAPISPQAATASLEAIDRLKGRP